MSERIPPGQHATRKLPVLHVGPIPEFDPERWTFTIDGLVAEPRTWSWDELRSEPPVALTADFHCVTTWSSLDQAWEGVRAADLVRRCGPLPEARFVMAHADGGYTTNLPLDDLLRDVVLLAWSRNGRPLEPEHGHPLRLVVPHLYGWKSAKWLRRLELLPEDRLGYWEELGYHRRGDPWAEERFA